MYQLTAIVLCALICKRMLTRQVPGLVDAACFPSCLHTFREAIMYLNSGYITVDRPQLLALKSVPVNIKQLAIIRSAIIWSGAHAAYCTYGVQDILGSSYQIRRRWMKNPIEFGSRIIGAYRLTK